MGKSRRVKPRAMNSKTKKSFFVGRTDLVNNANTEIRLLNLNNHICF